MHRRRRTIDKKSIDEKSIDTCYENWWDLNLNEEFFVHCGKKIKSPDLKTFHVYMGSPQAPDRIMVRQMFGDFDNFLDLGCGTCPELMGLKEMYRKEINYTGLDVTEKIVNFNTAKGINCVKSSLNNLPFEDNSFDIVHCRHVVEHMKGVETPLNEMIRVSRNKVFLCFFIDPLENADTVNPEHKMLLENEGLKGEIYHNQYNKILIDNLLKSNKKVKNFQWFKTPPLHSKSFLFIQV